MTRSCLIASLTSLWLTVQCAAAEAEAARGRGENAGAYQPHQSLPQHHQNDPNQWQRESRSGETESVSSLSLADAVAVAGWVAHL